MKIEAVLVFTSWYLKVDTDTEINQTPKINWLLILRKILKN